MRLDQHIATVAQFGINGFGLLPFAQLHRVLIVWLHQKSSPPYTVAGYRNTGTSFVPERGVAPASGDGVVLLRG